MTDPNFFFVGTVIFLLIFAAAFWHGTERRRKRADSLRRDENGIYVWIDFDGSEKRSSTHPGEKGGEWFNEDGGGDAGGD